ncbi:MAG: two-component regulator propeller domain-containing protein [Bacteroidota bacterium]
MKIRRKTYCRQTLFFSLLIIQELPAQFTTLDNYVSTSWSMEDGLPQSSVNDIIQSKDGYIWLATFGGLVRYNGESFTTFNRSNTKGIKSDRVLLIYEDREGAIWCSTEAGFSRFKDNAFKTFTIVDNTHTYSPLTITEDGRNVMWISANATPYRFSDSVFVEAPVLRDSSLARIAINNPNSVWIAHRKVLLRTLGDSIVLIKDFSSKLQNNIQCVVEFPERSGQLWFATTGDGVVRYADGTVRKYTTADGLQSNFVHYLYVDRSGNLWAEIYNGIGKLIGDRFVPLRMIQGEKENEFNTILHDREGNYWIGAPSKGLCRLRHATIGTIDNKDGLLEGKTLSLMRRKDGTFLFGTNCGGIYEWDGKRAIYSPLNAQLLNLCVWSIFEDSNMQLWIGSRILTRFDQAYNNKVVFDSVQGFNGLDIFAITEDSKKNVWIGCLNGLYVYNGKGFRQYTKEDGLISVDVRTLYEDKSGTMWIGTTDGLFKFDHEKIVPVPLTLLKGTNDEAISSYIRAIHQDETGTMWFGTYGGGILRLKEGRFSAITTNDGLFDNIVSHIIEDDQGYFWMGSNRGISRVNREELNNFFDGARQNIRATSFTTQDGMKSPETNGGFQPSVASDGKGKLFFPTVDGVAVVDTRNIVSNDIVPPVKIEQVVAGTRIMDTPTEIVLPYDSADFEIHYSTLSYVDRTKIQYKYILEGLNESWTEAGTRSRAYFTNIPPGTWTFRVIAANNDGVWNMTGASIQITITPPFWKTWWFYTFVGLFFVVAGPSVYYIRVTQLKNEKMKQQIFSERLINSQEQERRRIAMELHDGLGQQILIMKNRAELALNQVIDPVKTAEQLREIAQSAVSSINDIRSISHGLRPVHLEQFGLTETIKYLCEQLKQSSTIEWVCHIDDIDGIIPREKEINFYRILQEGANNILRYSSASQASVMIRRSDSEVTASVWDNGKGFDPEQKMESVGLGLSGIVERVNTLGGTCEITSQPNQGTSIMIILPVRHNG